ncbi:MAG: hypothetical protein FJW38_03250 [Acidobacteria bacterium]|nr:hypothetical protein [Acidobacteriota bacterium]
MTLHPDILTDLVILYHAGEASQASRTLLEEEARRNAQLAAALAAAPRAMAALPASGVEERRVLRKVRSRYLVLAFATVWCLALLALAILPRALATFVDVAILVELTPFLLMVLFFGGAIASLIFFWRRGC